MWVSLLVAAFPFLYSLQLLPCSSFSDIAEVMVSGGAEVGGWEWRGIIGQ